MLTSRYGFEARVLNGEIFVIGGYTKGEKLEFLSDTESYNPITNKWTRRASMNEKRLAPGVCFKYMDVRFYNFN